jgi:hypothetical protein
MSRSGALFPWLRPKATEPTLPLWRVEPAVTWWIESENGWTSGTFTDESEAWGAVMEFRRPASLVSSTGLRFVIPV